MAGKALCSATQHGRASAPALPLPPWLQQDIPALAAAAAAAHPGVECVVAEPIGIDALMAQLIENRVAAAAAGGAPVVPAAAPAPAAAGGGGGSGSDG